MADAGAKKTDRIIRDVEKRIKKEYSKAEEEARVKLNSHLSKFKKKDKIKAKQVSDGLLKETDYKRWRAGQIATGERWGKIVNELAETYTNAGKIASGYIQESMYDTFALNRNFGAFQIEKQVNGAYRFTMTDRNTVKKLVKDNPDLLPKPKVNIKKAMKWNQQKINSAILQGILQGESLDRVALRLRAVTRMDTSASTRNARTMMTSAQNAGRMDAYREAEEMGIEMEKVWLSTLDERTRESHAEMYGEAVEVDEEFSNGLQYPADPSGDPSEVYNCRCTLISRVKGVKLGLGSIDGDYTEENYERWLDNRAEWMGLHA